MKFIKSFYLSVVLILVSACTLSLQEDPNAVQPDQALPNLLLNSIQRNTAVMFNTLSTFGMQMTRLQNGGGALYNNAYSPQDFDAVWSTAYAGVLQDAKVLLEKADKEGLARHAGMSRIMSAYILTVLVDNFGKVPYSQAFKGAENFNPAADEMTDLYNEALAMLVKSKEDLTTLGKASGGYLNVTAEQPQDQYYGGDYTKWVKLANTLMLKIYLNMREQNPSLATTEINKLIADPAGLIASPAENFVYRYGTNLSDPSNRHPRFTATYLAGGGQYQSNWLMWHMFHGYDATSGLAPVGQGDPRMRFYFYRQVNANSSDPSLNRCVLLAIPDHYPKSSAGAIVLNPKAGLPPGIGYNPAQPLSSTNPNPAHPAWGRTFCYPSNIGYWGRDHLDPQGIPPDGLMRTMWGPYPVGGRFDANVNTSVNQNVGMRGAGMQPLMMRSSVRFMLAEAALYLGTTGTPLIYFQDGIRFSMEDVRTWSVSGTFGVGAAAPTEATTINTFYPAANYTTDMNNYITKAGDAYNAQTTNDDRMNYIAREHWIASFGNGVEAYNLYRRTGMPRGMQPTQTELPGAFPRTFWYPASFATLNSSSGGQKADLTGKVFWDNNSNDLGF